MRLAGSIPLSDTNAGDAVESRDRGRYAYMEVINPMVRRFTRQAIEDPEAFWAQAAEQMPLVPQVGHRLRMDAADVPLVRRRQTNLCYNCLDYHVERGRGGQRRSSPRTSAAATRLHLRPAPGRGEANRRRPSRPGHRQRRPHRHLHADLPGGDYAYAGRRAHRRHPRRHLRRLRRQRVRRPRRPHRRPRHLRRRRHLPKGQRRLRSRR